MPNTTLETFTPVLYITLDLEINLDRVQLNIIIITKMKTSEKNVSSSIICNSSKLVGQSKPNVSNICQE